MDETLYARVVVFEFIGGPHDGLVVQEVMSHGYDEAGGLLWRADGGRPGTEFWMPTDYAMETLRIVSLQSVDDIADVGYRFPVHWYEVIARRFGKQAIQIRAKHSRVSE